MGSDKLPWYFQFAELYIIISKEITFRCVFLFLTPKEYHTFVKNVISFLI